jgi:hypothetical protein
LIDTGICNLGAIYDIPMNPKLYKITAPNLAAGPLTVYNLGPDYLPYLK